MIAFPLYEDAAGIGAGAPAAAAAVADAPLVESESLSDHEAAFSPGAAQRAETGDDDAPTERDTATGQFKPRHRAASQRADADDVPLIAEQTKRIKDAEARLGADIVKKDGESERVFTLRRRAELLERQAATPTPVAPSQRPQAPQPQPQRQAIPQTFPKYEEFITYQGNESIEYEDYLDIRARWNYAHAREQERASEAQETRQRTDAERSAAHLARVPAAKQKYPDWDTVVTADIPLTAVLRDAILASSNSTDIQYHLGKNRAEAADLYAESQDYSPSAVAAMRRYLDSLVASQRSPVTPPSPAAGPTGAALRLAPLPAPRPPTPVRTSAVTPTDEPPGDDASLAAHEKYYAPRRGR